MSAQSIDSFREQSDITPSRESANTFKNTFYAYDYAGRLSKEKSGGSSSITEYSYDARGNILSVSQGNSTAAEEYSYAGDKLLAVDFGAGAYSIEHDSRGRVIKDLTPNGGQNISYNNYLDKISATSSVNYSYLANGTRTSSLITTSGDSYGLIYRGPFILRQRPDNVWVMEGVEWRNTSRALHR